MTLYILIQPLVLPDSEGPPRDDLFVVAYFILAHDNN